VLRRVLRRARPQPSENLLDATVESRRHGRRAPAGEALEDRLAVHTEVGINFTGMHAPVGVDEHVAHRRHVHGGVEHLVLLDHLGQWITQQREVQT